MIHILLWIGMYTRTARHLTGLSTSSLRKLKELIMSEKLTQKRLKELLHYDPEAGVFIWKNPQSNRIKKGGVAGFIDNCGYRRISTDGKKYIASRLAWILMEGYIPENEIDHINRIRNDDKWRNLRHVTRQCNLRNSGKSKNNKSGVVGVSWSTRDCVWRAQICINRKGISLGQSISKVHAVKIRLKAEIKYNFFECIVKSTAYQYLLARGLVDEI